MKSIVEEVQKKYPYIGKCNLGIIILFTAPKDGVILAQDKAKLGGNKEIGERSNNIHEDDFTLFKGSIRIFN